MVVEVVVAEGHPLYVVLAVEQSVVAVLVGSVAIEEFAMVNPDVCSPIGFCTALVCLYAYAVRVADLDLPAVAERNDLVFS